MALNLEALALLELIESRGSFAAAAAALNKAPSAITYQLRQLEESLDLLIYDRTGHKALLTPAGKILLEEGRKLLQDSESLRKRVKAIASGWEPELRVVLDSLIPFSAIMPWVREFDALKSPTRLRFTTEVLSGTWEALYSGRADLLIGSRLNQSQFASSTGLNLMHLGKARFVFAVSPKHPLANATEPVCASTLGEHRAIAVGDTSRNFKPLSFGIQAGQEVLTVPTLRDKIQAQVDGLGCGWVPLHFAKKELELGLLVTRKVEEDDRESDLCAAWHRGHQGRALSWWTEFLAHQQLTL
jgi:DNA-binding transcriptional LysR family regulator